MNLNGKIVIRTWGDTQDDAGGSAPVQVANWTMRANIEERSGSRSFSQSQEQWQYDYKITFRYEKTRTVPNDATIDYDGKRLRINYLEIKKEVDRRFYIARCSTLETLTLDTSYSNYEVNTIYIPAEEGNTTVVTELIGKKIIGVFIDGANFSEVEAEPFTDKQFIFVSGTGTFTWSVNLIEGAQITIQYGNV